MRKKLKALNLSKNWEPFLAYGKWDPSFQDRSRIAKVFFTAALFFCVRSLYARKDYFGSGNDPWSDMILLVVLFFGLLLLIAPFLCLLAGFGMQKAPRAVFVVPFLITGLFGLGLCFPGILELVEKGKLEIYFFVGLVYSVIAAISLIAYNKKLKKEELTDS